MTQTLRTPRQTAAAPHQRPFTSGPRRWEKERSRALRTGHVHNDTCSAACQPVLVHERISWGWLAWTVPGDGTRPEVPQQIGVLTPGATLPRRLALRWLTRRPAQHIAPYTAPGSLRFSVAAVALVSLVDPDRLPCATTYPLTSRCRRCCSPRSSPSTCRAGWTSGPASTYGRVEGDGAVRSLQRLAILHTSLVQAAAGSDRYALRRSAEAGSPPAVGRRRPDPDPRHPLGLCRPHRL